MYRREAIPCDTVDPEVTSNVVHVHIERAMTRIYMHVYVMHERKFYFHKTGVVSNVSFLQGTDDGRRWTVRERGQKENHNELTNIIGGPA